MGDPMFRVSERTLLSESKITDNSHQLEDQLVKLIHNMASSAAKNGAGGYVPEKMFIRRNSEWLSGLNAIGYISKYGRYFQANMTARLNSDTGLSYQELSYQILQAIDFSQLYHTDSVNTQLGGNDQWGNICSGLHLASRLFPEEQFLGLTVSLVTDKSGKKIGKSDGCTLWLDRNQTSPFDIYQYVYNMEKETSKKLAKTVTFLANDYIDEIFDSEEHVYQEIIAKEVTSIIHGENSGQKACSLSKDLAKLQSTTRIEDYEEILSPARTTILNQASGNPQALLDILTFLPSEPSKSELKRATSSGGLYINFKKISASQLLEPISPHTNQMMLVSLGRNSPYLIKMGQTEMA